MIEELYRKLIENKVNPQNIKEYTYIILKPPEQLHD